MSYKLVFQSPRNDGIAVGLRMLICVDALILGFTLSVVSFCHSVYSVWCTTLYHLSYFVVIRNHIYNNNHLVSL